MAREQGAAPRTRRKTGDQRSAGQPTFVAQSLPHWDRVSWPEVLFAVSVIGAPLALGSVHVVTQIILAALSLSAFIGASWKLSRAHRDVRVGWVGVAFFIALAWSFLLWLPLPAGLVAHLSPSAFAARATAASLAQLPIPDWMPLTLDAGRTAAGIVSLLAVTLTYLTATSLRQDSNTRARITAYIELAALGVLASAIIHNALDLNAIWGAYTPASGLPAFATSFVNPNHAAALMLLGALIAFGASLAPDSSQRSHLLIGVALSIGVLLSMSRANALLLLVGLIALTVPPLFLRRFAAHRGRLWRLLAGALCCLFVALVLIGPERWLSEFATIEALGLKHQGVFTYCWRVAQDVIGIAPLTGIGPGTFGPASTPFVETWQQGYLAYAHNGLYQALADLGLIVGGLSLLLLAAGSLRATLRGLRATPAELPIWATGVALAMLALQNLVDFSLWIQGVALPAAAALGLLIEWSWSSRPRRFALAWRWPLWASLIPLGMLIVTAIPALRDRPDAWRAAATTALASAPSSVDRAALITAHPHDYLAFDFAAALAEASAQPAEAALWLDRALELAPNDGATLEAAVRQRLRARDEAAAIALIDRLDPTATGEHRAVTLVLDAPWAKSLNAAFFARSPERSLAAARALTARNSAPQAEKLLVWALARFPDARALYRELSIHHWDDAPFLTKLATICLAEAGTNPSASAPWEQLGYLFQGRVEALASHPMSAYQLYLASADAAPTEGAPALIEAGKIAAQLHRADWLDDIVQRLQLLPLDGVWPRGDYHLLRSQLAEQRGDTATAIREMHEVLRHLNHVPGMHSRLAALYDLSGDPEAATRARARAAALAAPQAP